MLKRDHRDQASQRGQKKKIDKDEDEDFDFNEFDDDDDIDIEESGGNEGIVKKRVVKQRQEEVETNEDMTYLNDSNRTNEANEANDPNLLSVNENHDNFTFKTDENTNEKDYLNENINENETDSPPPSATNSHLNSILVEFDTNASYLRNKISNFKVAIIYRFSEASDLGNHENHENVLNANNSVAKSVSKIRASISASSGKAHMLHKCVNYEQAFSNKLISLVEETIDLIKLLDKYCSSRIAYSQEQDSRYTFNDKSPIDLIICMKKDSSFSNALNTATTVCDDLVQEINRFYECSHEWKTENGSDSENIDILYKSLELIDERVEFIIALNNYATKYVEGTTFENAKKMVNNWKNNSKARDNSRKNLYRHLSKEMRTIEDKQNNACEIM